ncbi:MAG: MIP family channel protein [Acidobacteriota bacterium]
MSNIRAPLAEFIGTFFLCFAGIAAILGGTQAVGSNVGLVGIALAHGLALSVAIATFGGVSGAHFNPAVTIALLATGRVAAPTALIYIVAQLAGATTAAVICSGVFPEAAVAQANLGIPLPGPWVTTSTLVLVEFVLTFLLVTAIFGMAVDPRGQEVKIGSFAVGMTVAFEILAAGPVTGASMNPARSFGPALVQGYWQWHWAYWVAPIAGGVVAAMVYDRAILDRRV